MKLHHRPVGVLVALVAFSVAGWAATDPFRPLEARLATATGRMSAIFRAKLGEAIVAAGDQPFEAPLRVAYLSTDAGSDTVPTANGDLIFGFARLARPGIETMTRFVTTPGNAADLWISYLSFPPVDSIPAGLYIINVRVDSFTPSPDFGVGSATGTASVRPIRGGAAVITFPVSFGLPGPRPNGPFLSVQVDGGNVCLSEDDGDIATAYSIMGCMPH